MPAIKCLNQKRFNGNISLSTLAWNASIADLNPFDRIVLIPFVPITEITNGIYLCWSYIARVCVGVQRQRRKIQEKTPEYVMCF